jgi:hypothetical protein
MKVWKLRLCKIAPGVTLAALFGYTCAVVTEPNLLSTQLNTLVLAWLLVANMITIGLLAFALAASELDELRALIARRSPRLRFMAVPEQRNPFWNAPTQPGVYGRRADQPKDLFSQLERDMTLDPPTGDIAA